MSKFIGTITDKSYYQQYSRDKGNRTYYYRICAYCEKEVEDGFSDLDGGNCVGNQHRCKVLDKFAEIDNHSLHLRTHIEFLYGRFEWGQFIFKEASYVGY